MEQQTFKNIALLKVARHLLLQLQCTTSLTTRYMNGLVKIHLIQFITISTKWITYYRLSPLTKPITASTFSK